MLPQVGGEGAALFCVAVTKVCVGRGSFIRGRTLGVELLSMRLSFNKFQAGTNNWESTSTGTYMKVL